MLIPYLKVIFIIVEVNSIWYDKQAMLIASHNLGYNRISIIAEHYLKA